MNPFDRMYEGTPPWEIGRSQPFIDELLARDAIVGQVLDLGCGSGENALAIAARDHDVVGVDISPRAVRKARAKAATRGIASVDFKVGDALDASVTHGTFDVIIDSGLFHVFSDEERLRYARNVAQAARPGTTLYVMCFSDREPAWGGPRRVTRDELRAAFGEPWAVERIEPHRFATLLSEEGAQAWLATIAYIGRRVSRGN